MRRSRSVISWLPLVLLTACVASHPGEHHAGTIQPAVDRLLNRGDIEVAQMHLRAFGFDPGPIDGIYTAQTQAAIRAFHLWAGGVGTARAPDARAAESGAGLQAG